MSYKKHYPTDAARRTACRHLLAVLRRAPGRRARWHHQAQRRRPWLLRPLTPGEQNLLRYRGLAQELAGHLAPFRSTRSRGHGDLYGLLCDRDTRPAVLAQVLALEECVARITPVFRQLDQQLDRWRQEWSSGTEAQRQRLTQVDKALLIGNYYTGLSLLLKEAQADTHAIRILCPPAFEPAAVTPAPTSPTPYSA